MYDDHGQFGNFGNTGGVGFFIAMCVLLILFAIGLGVLIWFLTRRPNPHLAQPQTMNPLMGSAAAQPGVVSSARTILDERFARGEIDADEYRSRRLHLDDS